MTSEQPNKVRCPNGHTNVMYVYSSRAMLQLPVPGGAEDKTAVDPETMGVLYRCNECGTEFVVRTLRGKIVT